MKVIQQIKEEPAYFAKRSGMYALGKRAAHEIAHPLGEALGGSLESVTPDMVLQIGSLLAPTFHEAVAQVATIGLVGTVSAGLVQMDYVHKRGTIRELYKEEIAAKLKKPVEKITNADLEAIGDRNITIGGELRRSRRERNFGVIFSFVASMAALAVVEIALPAVLGQFMAVVPKAMSLLHPIATYSLERLGMLAANMAVGLTSYNAIKIPLQWAADKIFGFAKETAHDRIAGLQREREMGKVITPAHVLSVFAKANPALDEFISVNYGDRFDKLDAAGKRKAVMELSHMMPLLELTHGINSGKINATELAFAVEGKISGVEHKEGVQPREETGLWAVVRRAFGFKPHAKVQVGAVAMQTPEAGMAMAYAEQHTGLSHVERLGRPKFDPSKGFVDLIDQQATVQPVSQSIN